MDFLITFAAFFGLAMLTWDCVEVGRNDAANLVNAVFGSRVMRRRQAVWLAGVAVILGATVASPVMETARKGVFTPAMLDELGDANRWGAIVVYVSVYLVDTILLYTYSAFGMPVSTTASLVFELVGASIGVSLSLGIVNWDKVGSVLAAIIFSILISGIAGFLIQRVFRGAIRDRTQDHNTVLLHGPWIAGLMFTWLSWFMIMKGLKALTAIDVIRGQTFDRWGTGPTLLILWGVFTLIIFLILRRLGLRGTGYLFHFTAIVGMICMAFAFGQNDLANCASPGLSAWWIYLHPDLSVGAATKVDIGRWALFLCGTLMVMGMFTRNAQRVTRAQVNTGSQFDHVALWAPEWCRSLARVFIRPQLTGPDMAPPPSTTPAGKRVHYDTLRASVIMAVSASVIAFASGNGYPVSTTYVSFAAVVATGWGDRIFHRGDADLKMGRAIWVVTCWFLAAVIAMVSAAIVAFVIFKLKWLGFALGLGTNLGARYYFKRRSDAHEVRYHKRKSSRQDAGGFEAESADDDGEDEEDAG